MALSLRKRHFIRRLAGYGINPALVTLRTRLGREQDYEIGGVPVVLPPEHNLPFYQRRDPSYDRYAEEIVATLADRPVTVIDVGANVGDTTVAMLSTGPHVSVVAVEGSPRFTEYLRRNVAAFGSRVAVVERFVGPVGAAVAFSEDNGTGGFQSSRAGATTVQDWVTPADLLARAPDDDVVVWKSDIDGFDIHVLVDNWRVVTDRCAVLWFEFDPVGTLGDPGDVRRLADLIGASGRHVRVYDNLGRAMVSLPPGPGATRGLEDLAAWLVQQRDGHVTVPYVDVWAVDPVHSDLLDVVHTSR